MKRLLMTFAAMLLVSVGAFAQSNEPLQGDVNGDGVVDVADIAAVIAIIKNNADTPQTTYYWYIGTASTKPSSLPTSDSQLATGTNEGWRKFTQTSGIVYNASTLETKIRFNTSAYYWLIIPTGMKVEVSDGNNYLLGFESSGEYGPDTTTIPNYTIYASKWQGGEFSGILKY